MSKKYNEKYSNAGRAIDNAFYKFSETFSKGDFVSNAVYSILDKSMYEDSNEEPQRWVFPQNIKKTNVSWQKITNLPNGIIGKEDAYRSNERIQNFLCSEHTMQHTVNFLMLRQKKYTGLYIGAASKQGGADIPQQLRENMQLNMPGARFEDVACAEIGDKEYFNSVEFKISQLRYCGVITGQPSIRSNEKENPIQTLDRLATGIINFNDDTERDYALLVISEPVSDAEVKGLIQKMQSLKSSLHEFAAFNESMSVNKNVSKGESTSFSANLGSLVLTAGGMLGGLTGGLSIGAANMVNFIANSLGLGVSKNYSVNESIGEYHSGSKEHVNFAVKYCETLLDKAIKRMEQGRNLGFWNTGIYVLGDSTTTVDLVMAELRSVYSGDETYQEPIRTFNFCDSSDVRYYANNLQLLSFPSESLRSKEAFEIRNIAENLYDDNTWHIFGNIYQYMSTPMTTEELSIVMSLPRKDVPGLHIKKDAVEFATNPPSARYKTRGIMFGEIQDMGAPTGHIYNLDLDQLNRHGALFGLNGGGKTVTSKRILKGMLNNDIPFMVIDPVKTDYAFWADDYNQKHKNEPNFKPIKIFAPGLSSIPGLHTPLSKLSMNPFQPYAAKGAPLNMQGHISSLLGLLNKTMAMGDFLPMLLEEAVVQYLEASMEPGIADESELDAEMINRYGGYPKLSGLVKKNGTVDRILNDRNYSTENTQNFRAAIQTRVNSLTRGWKKDFFESECSTGADDLFECNSVICLAGVTNNSDKSFFMSLLLQAASEYRQSLYQYDTTYRERVQKGRKEHGGNYLAHYTVVEEAHRILQVPNSIASDSDPQAAAAEKFCEMLSEIREPGEGLMIIDQYPSRLVADAIKNTNLKIIHRLQAIDDREAMAGCMSLNDMQSRLLATLKKGDAVICSEQDDSAMWLHILYEK